MQQKIITKFHDSYAPEPNTGCWLWTAGLLKGYPRFRLNKKSFMGHRLSYQIYNGLLEPTMLVCHKCDTPTCVNPSHLFKGTHRDNYEDAINKNRLEKFFENREGNSWHKFVKKRKVKITDRQVVELKKKRSQGVRASVLAEQYEISLSQVHRIIKGSSRAISVL